MLYIIDGTGPFFNEPYKKVMSGGFCERMSQKYVGKYYRGPNLAGTDTYDIADRVYIDIRADPMFGKRPLFLAGHSRGGAAAIYIAQRLKADKKFVDGLFLFDAVDRTRTDENVQSIPRNVRVSYHARRNPSLSTYFEWGATDTMQKYVQCWMRHPDDPVVACRAEANLAYKYRRLDDAMKVRMRASAIVSIHDGYGIDFGNCGLGLEPACNTEEARWSCEYNESIFLGSHGSIGGSPIGEQDDAWRSEEDKARFAIVQNNDRAAVSSVWSWMEDNFKEARLDLHLNVTDRPALRLPW